METELVFTQEMEMLEEHLQAKFKLEWLVLMFQFQYQWHSTVLEAGKDLSLGIVGCTEWKELNFIQS